MDKPEISVDFTIDDLRKLRDYNSWRHNGMSFNEIKTELQTAVYMFDELLAERRKAKPAQI